MAAKGWRKRNTHIPDATKMVEGVKDSLTTQQEQGKSFFKFRECEDSQANTTPQSVSVGEPVAKYVGEDWNGSLVSLYEDIPLNTLLYTTPPPQQRKPLTDEQKLDLVTNWFAELWAIEKAMGLLDDYVAAHGIKEEKNT